MSDEEVEETFGFASELMVDEEGDDVSEDSDVDTVSDTIEDRSPSKSVVTANQQDDDASNQDQALDMMQSQNTLFKSGWLKKKGGGSDSGSRHEGSIFARKNWKKRWFQLKDTIFKYYKNDTSHRGKALGFINLDGRCLVESDGGTYFKLSTPKRTFELEAATASIAAEWVALVTDAINTAELDSL